MSSSVNPSARYSLSASGLRLVNGSTASVKIPEIVRARCSEWCVWDLGCSEIEHRDELTRAGRTIVRVLLEATPDERRQCLRDVGAFDGDRRRRLG